MFKRTLLFFILLVGTVSLSGCDKTIDIYNPITSGQTNFDNLIAQFEEKLMSSWESKGKPVCAVKTLWQKEAGQDQLVVYASSECMSVVVKNDDLYSTSGYGATAKLYQLTRKGNDWGVTDYDERDFKMETTKQWVKDYEKTIPENIKNNFDAILLGASLTKKAGEIFNITTPNYSFKKCSKDQDCNKDEVCDEPGAFNQGGNKCVKKCTTYEDCGKGYSCRGSCIHGENGCPSTAVNICTPDLPADTLDKKSQPW
ncbi:MAG: hypothetical protein WCW16_05400 [Candidatus Magasanikbacteria bacterium]